MKGQGVPKKATPRALGELPPADRRQQDWDGALLARYPPTWLYEDAEKEAHKVD